MLNLAVSVTQLGLRPRSVRMLANAGVTTVAEIVGCTEAVLRSLGLDDRAINDLTEILAMHELALREVVADPAPDIIELCPATVADGAPLATRAAPLAEPERPNDILSSGSVLEGVVREDDLRELERAFNGIRLREKRAGKPQTLTDDRRATAFAERVAKGERRKSARPNRDDARINELRETLTLTVEEVAFLYNVSRDAMYDALKRPACSIPHTRIGKRIVIPTRRVFEALGLE